MDTSYKLIFFSKMSMIDRVRMQFDLGDHNHVIITQPGHSADPEEWEMHVSAEDFTPDPETIYFLVVNAGSVEEVQKVLVKCFDSDAMICVFRDMDGVVEHYHPLYRWTADWSHGEVVKLSLKKPRRGLQRAVELIVYDSTEEVEEEA